MKIILAIIANCARRDANVARHSFLPGVKFIAFYLYPISISRDIAISSARKQTLVLAALYFPLDKIRHLFLGRPTRKLGPHAAQSSFGQTARISETARHIDMFYIYRVIIWFYYLPAFVCAWNHIIWGEKKGRKIPLRFIVFKIITNNYMHNYAFSKYAKLKCTCIYFILHW